MNGKWKYIIIGLIILPLLLNPLGLILAVLGLLLYPFIRAAMRAGAEDAERMKQGLPPKNAWMGDNPFKKK